LEGNIPSKRGWKESQIKQKEEQPPIRRGGSLEKEGEYNFTVGCFWCQRERKILIEGGK